MTRSKRIFAWAIVVVMFAFGFACTGKVYGNAVPERRRGIEISADGHRIGRFIIVDNLVAQGGHKRFAIVDDLMLVPPAEFDTKELADAARVTLEAADVVKIEESPPTPVLPQRRGVAAPVTVTPTGKLDNNTIAAAGVSGEIVLDDGTYNASDLVAVSGIRIRAKNPATLDTNGILKPKVTINIPAGRDFIYVNAGVNGVRISDIQFTGSTAIAADGKNSDGVVERCAFTNFENGKDRGFGRGTAIGVPFGWQPRNWRVQHCSFRDSPNGWGTGHYRGDGDAVARENGGARGLEILDCEFVNILNGCKSNNVGTTSFNDSIQRCYFAFLRRMVAEYQGCSSGLWFTDNVVEKTIVSNIFQQNINLLGASLITHGINQGPIWNIVCRNLFLIPEINDGTGPRLFLEFGNLTDVYENYVRGSGKNTAFAWFMGDSNPANQAAVQAHPEKFVSKVHDNHVENINFGGGEGGPYDNKVERTNNGPTVVMKTWDVNRARPGPLRAGGVVTTQPSDPVDPVKTFTSTATPLDLSNDYKSKGASVAFSFTNVPVGTTTVRVLARATGDPVKLIGAETMLTTTKDLPSVGGIVSGLRVAWQLQFQFTFIGANNQPLGTSDWMNTLTTKGTIGPEGSGLTWPLKPATTQPTTEPTTQPADDGLDYDIVIPIRRGRMLAPTTRRAA